MPSASDTPAAGTTLQQSIFSGPRGVKRTRKDEDEDEAVGEKDEDMADEDEEGSAMEESDDD
jgi:hypothetical protein